MVKSLHRSCWCIKGPSGRTGNGGGRDCGCIEVREDEGLVPNFRKKRNILLGLK